jgi:hypothetical protein
MGKNNKTNKHETAILTDILTADKQLRSKMDTDTKTMALQVLVGILVLIIPCGLYFSPIYAMTSDALNENMKYFALGTLLSGIILGNTYNGIGAKRRSSYLQRIKDVKGSAHEKAIKQTEMISKIYIETTAWGMMVVNFAFYPLYFFFAGYMLPSFELLEGVEFIVAGVGSASIIYGCSKIDIKLPKLHEL